MSYKNQKTAASDGPRPYTAPAIAVVRDRVSGALFRLISTDWKEAAFWRETIVGGIVRAQTGEGLALYDGRRVLLEAGAFDAWRNTQMRRRSQPAKAACQEWLEAAMREAHTFLLQT